MQVFSATISMGSVVGDAAFPFDEVSAIVMDVLNSIPILAHHIFQVGDAIILSPPAYTALASYSHKFSMIFKSDNFAKPRLCEIRRVHDDVVPLKSPIVDHFSVCSCNENIFKILRGGSR